MGRMKPALDISVPATWMQPTPPNTEYVVAGVTITFSVVQGLPEDPPEWLRVEAARRDGGTPTIERVTTQTGYSALIAETAAGANKLMLVMYQFLELGAVATVIGPSAIYDEHIAAIRDVLMRVRVKWGAPLTLFDLLDGATRS